MYIFIQLNISIYVYSKTITTHHARNIYIHTDCKYAYMHIHARTRTTISHVNRYMYVCINIHVCTHIHIYKTLMHATILDSQHEHPDDAYMEVTSENIYRHHTRIVILIIHIYTYIYIS